MTAPYETGGGDAGKQGYMAAEEMRDGNKRDVGQQRWRNGLKGR